jgi:hypothetical protein
MNASSPAASASPADTYSAACSPSWKAAYAAPITSWAILR